MRRAPLLLLLAGALVAAGSDAPVDRMVRPLFEARSVTARILLYRSDPFGGAPERSEGRLWYQPGRGLRVRFERHGGEEILADRAKGELLLYRASEGVVRRSPWDRAPARIRRLVEDPESLLAGDLGTRPERLPVVGAERAGYRLGGAALGDSSRGTSLWVAADPKTGLLRWITLSAEDDTVWVELSDLALRSKARARDLTLSAPPGAKVEPLDPRDLLRGGESR
jgi:outer membrane lipoprotein-sorting protein